MQTIFIMVKCDLGQAYEVADRAVQEVEQVSEVHSTSGQYDLLMKCYLDDGIKYKILFFYFFFPVCHMLMYLYKYYNYRNA